MQREHDTLTHSEPCDSSQDDEADSPGSDAYCLECDEFCAHVLPLNHLIRCSVCEEKYGDPLV